MLQAAASNNIKNAPKLKAMGHFLCIVNYLLIL